VLVGSNHPTLLGHRSFGAPLFNDDNIEKVANRERYERRFKRDILTLNYSFEFESDDKFQNVCELTLVRIKKIKYNIRINGLD